jgi:hypothetical protein
MESVINCVMAGYYRDNNSLAVANRASIVQGGGHWPKTPKIQRFRADTVRILANCGETGDQSAKTKTVTVLI